MSAPLDSRTAPAWVLCAALAVLSLGLVAESQNTTTQAKIPPPPPAFGTSDSNSDMIAVTGVDVTGGSLLYLIDTRTRHLSIYQAQGGTASTSNVRWVGGRNIDLDLQVDGFNDKSEMSYKELARRFADDGADVTSEKH